MCVYLYMYIPVISLGHADYGAAALTLSKTILMQVLAVPELAFLS